MNDTLPRRERSSLTGFAVNRLDRREDSRNKPDAVTALRHRSDTLIAAVAGETPILNRIDGETLSVWFSHGEAEMLGPALEEIFLGMAEDGSPRFGRLLDRALAETLKERSELVVTDLRSVALKRLEGELPEMIRNEGQARRLTERLALVLQGSLLLRFAPPAVADAFIATRLGEGWSGQFGDLPPAADAAALARRAVPAI